MYHADYAEQDDGIYWHLFRGEERVNGGLARGWEDAALAVNHAKWRDEMTQALRRDWRTP